LTPLTITRICYVVKRGGLEPPWAVCQQCLGNALRQQIGDRRHSERVRRQPLRQHIGCAATQSRWDKRDDATISRAVWGPAVGQFGVRNRLIWGTQATGSRLRALSNPLPTRLLSQSRAVWGPPAVISRTFSLFHQVGSLGSGAGQFEVRHPALWGPGSGSLVWGPELGSNRCFDPCWSAVGTMAKFSPGRFHTFSPIRCPTPTPAPCTNAAAWPTR
jgi:hypothetical protein